VFTRDPITVAVTEPTQVGEARRLAAVMSEALGFDSTVRGAIAIVVTEIATNLVRHASAGEIVLRSLPPVNCCGLEILGLDRGPGIASMADAMRDGFSTALSPGNGMGAMHRLSTVFDVYSAPGHGTAVVAQFRVGDSADDMHARVGCVCLPKHGEEACGDSVGMADLGGGRTVVMIADGLGHGLQAAVASRKAVQLFRDNPSLDGPSLMNVLHNGLKSTRGAAISIADLRRGQGELRFTGVGNVAGRIVHATAARGLVSQNGTVGAAMRQVQEFVYPWTAGAVLVMHTDGLGSHWQMSQYAGLTARHPSLIAGVLYRDGRRERDDVTVLALTDRGRA
jgi:anti-sigma regulatory factor (Ser/Thr protein kinase)